MTPKQHMVSALRDLCEREGGPVAVADTIGANDQTLKQILAGTKLRSGEPRGVGPGLQRRLEAHYPGWASLSKAPHQPSAQEPTPAVYRLLDVAGALQIVVRALAPLDAAQRNEIVKVFALVADYPDEPDYRARLVKLLEAPTRRRQKRLTTGA